jgi:hypothetical protein
LKKTTAALAIAALAVPAAAQAHDGPDNDGKKNAAERQERNAERQKQREGERRARSGDDRRHDRRGHKRSKGVGFVVAGLVTSAVPTFNKDAADTSRSPFTFGAAPSLDVIAANKHARKVLNIDRAKIRSTDAVALPIALTDKFKLRLNGLTDANNDGIADDLKAGDRIVVLGKVKRTRTKGEDRRSARAARKGKAKRAQATYGEIDVRKVVVSRPGTKAPEQDD